jgi:hypothetical protein
VLGQQKRFLAVEDRGVGALGVVIALQPQLRQPPPRRDLAAAEAVGEELLSARFVLKRWNDVYVQAQVVITSSRTTPSLGRRMAPTFRLFHANSQDRRTV